MQSEESLESKIELLRDELIGTRNDIVQSKQRYVLLKSRFKMYLLTRLYCDQAGTRR
jgi:hypothetical protein